MRILTASLLSFLVAGFSPVSAQQLSDAEFVTRASAFTLAALPEVPVDPSNRFDGDPRAISLGESLFFDKGLSRSGDVACATCHVTEGSFVSNETMRADAFRKHRTTMPLQGAAYQTFFFWDGRADSLWMQALGPFENDFEHDLTRSEVVSYVLGNYASEATAIMPELLVGAQIPDVQASPVGNTTEREAWSSLTSDEQERINVAFSFVGKVIAAFEASIPVTPTRWDRIIEAAQEDPSALHELTDAERSGFEIFVGKGRCASCHDGPLFTDADFHNTGLPQVTMPMDLGRQSALLGLRNNPFNCLGPYSDADEGDCGELKYMSYSMERAMGAFRTPTLRGAVDRKHLGHAGQISSVEEMIRHYNQAPAGPHGALMGMPSLSELTPLGLSELEIQNLLAFLKTLGAGG